MALTIFALVLSLLIDGLAVWGIYSTGANPWYCMFGLIIWIPIFISVFGIWVIALIFWGMFLDKKTPTDRPNPFYYGVIRQTLQWFFLIARIRVHVRGEKLPNEPYLLVSNHRSNFDQMALIAGLRKMLICITKPENLDFPIAGPFIHHAGFIPINRENMSEGIESIHQASDYLRKGYCNIGVAPEGTRNKTEELLLPFKPGSFHIGTDVRAPIVVCCIKNADKVRKNSPLHVTHIFLDILLVTKAEQYEEMGLNKYVSYCESVIRRDLEEGDMLLDLSFD